METELFLPWVAAPRVYVRAWTLCSFHSLISTPNLSEGADSVGGQLRGDKEFPYSGVTKPFLSLAGAATSIIFVATNLLSRQTRICRHKSFVATNTCLPPQKFCRDKHVFAATKHVLTKAFVATKLCLSRQRFCRDKHTFVATKDVLWHEHDTCGSSRQ